MQHITETRDPLNGCLKYNLVKKLGLWFNGELLSTAAVNSMPPQYIYAMKKKKGKIKKKNSKEFQYLHCYSRHLHNLTDGSFSRLAATLDTSSSWSFAVN